LGSISGAPELISRSLSLRSWALHGTQKSIGWSDPVCRTFRRIADSPRWGGGAVPGVGTDGTSPLPATNSGQHQDSPFRVGA
jgi:hypothetical protein